MVQRGVGSEELTGITRIPDIGESDMKMTGRQKNLKHRGPKTSLDTKGVRHYPLTFF